MMQSFDPAMLFFIIQAESTSNRSNSEPPLPFIQINISRLEVIFVILAHSLSDAERVGTRVVF